MRRMRYVGCGWLFVRDEWRDSHPKLLADPMQIAPSSSERNGVWTRGIEELYLTHQSFHLICGGAERPLWEASCVLSRFGNEASAQCLEQKAQPGETVSTVV